MTVTNCTISGNSAGAAAGILNLGTMAIINSTISGNDGGGISSGGMLTVTNSTISGNIGNGGISNSGTMVIINSTISGNSAGGIDNFATLTITNSTISGNSIGGSGGGVANDFGGTVNVRNTIIALNTGAPGPDFSGPLTSQGYNLIGNTSGTTITGRQPAISSTSIRSSAPCRTTAGRPSLTPCFPAAQPSKEATPAALIPISAGWRARLIVRSSPTPAGGDGSDIGAYEVQADQLPGCNNINRVVNNNNDSGTDSLRAVIANVCAGSTITFAPNVTGAINLTSGELLINKSLTINGPGANLLSVQRSAAAGNFRIFNIAPASVIATISGLTIANGNSPGSNGGGIYNNGGTLTVSNSTLSGNSAGSGAGGGGIFNNVGTLTVSNSTISGNSASFGGGGINSFRGTVTVTNSTISGNTINGGNGGGIYTLRRFHRWQADRHQQHYLRQLGQRH